MTHTSKTSRGEFIKQWLLHAFVYWAVTNAYTLFDYGLKVQKNGNFLWHTDGSPTTITDYFVMMNYYNLNWLGVLLYTCLADLLRVSFYNKRRFSVFIIMTIAAGMLWTFGRALYFNLKVNAGQSLFDLDAIQNFVLYVIVYTVAREFVTQKLYKRSVRDTKSAAELNALKAQVNPHFFFNTFNYVYGTAIAENASKTATAIEMMTDMMRYTMAVNTAQHVPLTEELHFISNYVELQRLRLPERPNIVVCYSRPAAADSEGLIVPMLIIPLVENAFKYGISIDEQCFVKIELVTANNRLHIIIENSIVFKPDAGAGFGTGLTNVKARLKLLYPKNHQIEIKQEEAIFKVVVDLPLIM